ncbi:hypothetical protein MGWOODY_Tha1816 [hydrothermal vent metagenome]|uniref:Uncharacterized protein n=1 Tax=hydrothermal vent metagenome TaxID=652676 RepID=A0A160TES0_9ZZZZ
MAYKRYPFYDLHLLNRVIMGVMAIPGILCVAGFIHGFMTLQQLHGLAATDIITQLDTELQSRIALDSLIRITQISLTGVLGIFFGYWLFYAVRNLVCLYDEKPHTLKNTLIIFMRMLSCIFLALRTLASMRHRSAPEHHNFVPDSWLLPLWWLALVGANVSKIVAVYVLLNVDAVARLIEGMIWMSAAYVLYLAMYILTAILINEIGYWQRVNWQSQQDLPVEE